MSEGDRPGSGRGVPDGVAKSREGASIRPHVAALLAYFVLALVATYPAVLTFTTAVPGDLLADRNQNLWNLWWIKESLGTNPFHTDFLFYPYGANLYYHTLALPLGLIGLLPQLLLGLPAAYNTVLLAAFTLSGYGAFRLALYVLGRPTTDQRPPALLYPAAFVGGVVFAFTPYTLDALKGQLEVLSVQWMPLFAEMWLRATTGDRPPATGGVQEEHPADSERVSLDPSSAPMTGTEKKQAATNNDPWWVYAALAGLFLALAAYSSLYYAVYLVIFALAHMAYRLAIAWRKKLTGEWSVAGRRSLVVAIVALALTLPLALGLAADYDNPRLSVSADTEHRLTHSADLLSFLAPPHDHIVFGTWQDEPGVNEPPIHDYLGLGYIALTLAIIGAAAAWRGGGTKFWVGVALLALLLAMGPQLQIGRNLTGIPLPFALLEKVPGMDAIAKPERFVVLARLCMGVLAALGVVWLVRKLAKISPAPMRLGRRLAGITTIILALLLVELPLHPRYMGPYAIPQGFDVLAQQPPGGLMELPFATQQVDVVGQRMLYQTTHGKPIMSGYLSRNYDSPTINSCSPFWGFISPLDVPRQDIASPLVVSRLQDVLDFYKVRYVALYTKTGGPDAAPVDPKLASALRSIVQEVSPGTPLYSDSYMSLYTLPDINLSASPPSFHIGAGWYDTEQSDGVPFRWIMGGQGTLCVFAPHEVAAPLSLEATAFAQDQQISISMGDRQLFSAKLPASAFTPVTTPPINWKAGVTEVIIASNKPGVTPQSLDPSSKDVRALTIGLRRVYLAIDAQK